MIMHFRNIYSNITQSNIDNNNQNMARAWNPATHIKYLFEQLRVGQKNSTEESDALLATQLVHLGYNIIHKMGLFGTTCLEWRDK